MRLSKINKLFHVSIWIIVLQALLMFGIALDAKNSFEKKEKEVDVVKLEFENRLLKIQGEVEFKDLGYAGYTPMFVGKPELGEEELRCFCKDNSKFLEEGVDFNIYE